MIQPTKAGAILVEPSAKQRANLKGSLIATNLYSKIFQAKDVSECIKFLTDEKSEILIIFVAQDFPSNEKERLVKAAKKLPSSQDSAYVVVYKSDEQDTGTIAHNLMDGIDSFVVAPYSVESLVKTSQLAQKLKAERRQTRLERAVTFLLQDALKTVDEIAQRKLNGKSPGKLVKALKHQKEAVLHLDDELVPYFQALLPKMCEDAEPFPHHDPLFQKAKQKEELQKSRSSIGESPTALLNKIKAFRGR